VFFALSSIKQSGPCSSVIFHLLDLKLFWILSVHIAYFKLIYSN
jgi:hypothetical protein